MIHETKRVVPATAHWLLAAGRPMSHGDHSNLISVLH